jgi:hypothetical protein
VAMTEAISERPGAVAGGSTETSGGHLCEQW